MEDPASPEKGPPLGVVRDDFFSRHTFVKFSGFSVFNQERN